MLRPTSPRLPGVPILVPEVTGSEYARWRRNIQFFLEIEGVWGHCDGSRPMPMPEAGPNPISPIASLSTSQPSLLQERRAWVRQDREVKLDLFLSLAEEVMQDVFEVGPPLPPSNLNAKEMLDALDERFATLRFEDYHHTFCHFLNMHIDHYITLDEFNIEFQAALDDMSDYGYPLSNTQACSAYFSKLRCTQNSWVAKKLGEWDEKSSEPELADLMKESPPWAVVRSLEHKPIKTTRTDSIPEECLESPAQSDNEVSLSRRSNASTLSTVSSHSNHSSSTTARSQEIVVHASEDIASPDFTSEEYTKIDTSDFPKVPTFTTVQSQVLTGTRNSVLLMQHPIPIDRPLPPLPLGCNKEKLASNNLLPIPTTLFQSSTQISLALPMQSSPQSIPIPTPIPTPHSSKLKLETTHPTLRPRKQTSDPTPEPHRPQTAFDKEISSPNAIHPAFRSTPPYTAPLFNLSTSSPNLPLPWPSTPTHPNRPHKSLSFSSPSPHHPLFRVDVESANSSILSLPIQGTCEEDLPTTSSLLPEISRTPTFESIGIPRCISPSELTHPATETLQSQSHSRISTFDTLRSRASTFEGLRILRLVDGEGLGAEGKVMRKKDRKKSWGGFVTALKGGK